MKNGIQYSAYDPPLELEANPPYLTKNRGALSSAEGARIEAPKVPRGWGLRRGQAPSPSRLGRVWGSVGSSPSGVRGGAPATNNFGTF